MSKSIRILQGRARLYPPKKEGGYWRIAYYDRFTNKRRTTTGGKTRATAELRAAELVGDSTPHSTSGEEPPSVREVFHSWLDANESRWAEGTYVHYKQQGNYFFATMWEMPISQVAPRDFAKVSVAHLSRGQQIKVRTLARGMMTHASRWTQWEPDAFADAIPLSGSRAEDPERQVARGDVAPGQFISDVINACFSTYQLHPIYRLSDYTPREDTYQTHPIREYVLTNDQMPAQPHWTGATYVPNKYGEGKIPPALLNPITGHAYHFVMLGGGKTGRGTWNPFQGFSKEFVEKHHRRRYPKKFNKDPERDVAETHRVAERYRMFALMVALSAGIGLRVGEASALRVGDFIGPVHSQMENVFVNFRTYDQEGQLPRWGYKGELHISKQATSPASGKITLSLPKNRKRRDVLIPAVLYHPAEAGEMLLQSRREQVVNAGLGRFENPDRSLWSMSENEALQLWQEGIIPLGWMIMWRLNELWDALHADLPPGSQDYRYEDFRKLLIFPASRAPRDDRFGENFTVPKRWHDEIEIVPGYGGYMAAPNLASQLTNPIFDFVSEHTHSYPEHRRHYSTRQGWTFHALRHYFITSNIYHGVPLPLVSDLAGHASTDFTMGRYTHAIKNHFRDTGFE